MRVAAPTPSWTVPWLTVAWPWAATGARAERAGGGVAPMRSSSPNWMTGGSPAHPARCCGKMSSARVVAGPSPPPEVVALPPPPPQAARASMAADAAKPARTGIVAGRLVRMGGPFRMVAFAPAGAGPLQSHTSSVETPPIHQARGIPHAGHRALLFSGRPDLVG